MKKKANKEVVVRKQINKVKVVLADKEDGLVFDTKTIADIFEKDYKNVIRDLRGFSDFSDRISRLKIEPRDYVDSRGKTQPMYAMDKQTATMLMLGFTGEKAFKLRVRVLDMIEALELKVKALQQKIIDMQNQQILEVKGYGELNDSGLAKTVIVPAHAKGNKKSEYAQKLTVWRNIANRVLIPNLLGEDLYMEELYQAERDIEALTLSKQEIVGWRMQKERFYTKYLS